MAIDTLRRLMVFLVLVLSQALVFNHIRSFGYAMPLPYVYFAIAIPRGYPRWATLLWCFAMGLIIDLFSNTPGVATASLTFAGFVQPYLLELFVQREAAPNLRPSAVSLGWAKFVTLASILTFMYCVVFYSLEMFSFADPVKWVVSIVSSTVLTLILMMALESVRRS